MSIVSSITPANGFVMSQAFTSFTCPVTYNISNTLVTYPYNFLGKFVSTDYIYKIYTITQPHYQVRIRLSMAFIGVWSGVDYLNLNVSDGLTIQNFQMRYNCTDASLNYTETLCNTTRWGNRVDCIIPYEFLFNHNSSKLLVNFTSLTGIRDSNIQFWSLFDLNILTVNCHSFCAACYGSTNICCTSCMPTYFLNLNNTCDTVCYFSMYKLPNVIDPTKGGICVSSCPQGYYLSLTTCLPCISGCLSCTTSSDCSIYANSMKSYSLFQDKIVLWIIIIILGVFLTVGIVWKLLCSPKHEPLEEQ